MSTFVQNQPVRSCCGRPRGECDCLHISEARWRDLAFLADLRDREALAAREAREPYSAPAVVPDMALPSPYADNGDNGDLLPLPSPSPGSGIAGNAGKGAVNRTKARATAEQSRQALAQERARQRQAQQARARGRPVANDDGDVLVAPGVIYRE
jgi:hypothetical protein